MFRTVPFIAFSISWLCLIPKPVVAQDEDGSATAPAGIIDIIFSGRNCRRGDDRHIVGTFVDGRLFDF